MEVKLFIDTNFCFSDSDSLKFNQEYRPAVKLVEIFGELFIYILERNRYINSNYCHTFPRYGVKVCKIVFQKKSENAHFHSTFRYSLQSENSNVIQNTQNSYFAINAPFFPLQILIELKLIKLFPWQNCFFAPRQKEISLLLNLDQTNTRLT